MTTRPEPITTSNACCDEAARLGGRKVLLGVCGSIAAYKAAELCRLMVRGGAEVTVIMTEAATRFVGPLTFEALTGRRVRTAMFEGAGADAIMHIDLARQPDLVVVAPATADLVARAAAGRADDLLSCVLLATRAPVLLAPAMNPSMWAHPVTRRNVRTLQDLADVRVVGPAEGEAACGETGPGRMAEPADVLRAALGILGSDLAGLRVIVTAGPTHEAIDPVRFISNRSSGRMGYAIAACAHRRAARVTLISGPVALAPPPGVELVSVVTTADMHRETTARAVGADVVVMAAAVADYRAARPSVHKLKRGPEGRTIALEPNPDILAAVAAAREGSRPVLVGFALETEDLLGAAREKLERKGCDIIVANLADESLGRETSVAVILDRDGGLDEPGLLPKDALADRILDRVVARL